MNMHPLRFEYCHDCYRDEICRKLSVNYVSVAEVRRPENRLSYQNFLAGHNTSYHSKIDELIHVIRDYRGAYYDEKAERVGAPPIACLLTPGAEFWFREQLRDGAWISLDQVPKLRTEATSRWRIIGTVMNIYISASPNCKVI